MMHGRPRLLVGVSLNLRLTIRDLIEHTPAVVQVKRRRKES